MDKVSYFNKEYSYLKSSEKREDLKYLVSNLPDYFFEVPASSTGKYHPLYAGSENGLVKHTKVAVRIAKELLDNPGVNNFTDNEKDLIIMSLVLHDGLKKGSVEEKYTRFDHPILAANFLKSHQDKLSLNNEEIDLMMHMISSHMGIWNVDFNGNEVLPKPITKYERFVHMCDYLASKKFINVEFEGIDIKD